MPRKRQSARPADQIDTNSFYPAAVVNRPLYSMNVEEWLRHILDLNDHDALHELSINCGPRSSSSREHTVVLAMPMTRNFALLAVTLLTASNLLAEGRATPTKIQQTLDHITKDSAAVALVLETKSGRLLAVEKPEDAARLRSRPGSILKPFFLTEALERNVVRPQTTVFCRRSLHILGRNLQCTHPQSDVAFSADDALAYSCNTYFADLANRLSPTEATAMLQSYGFGEPSRLFTAESPSQLRAPTSMEQKQLFVLGLAGVAVTPAQVAVAYRRLALKLADAKAVPIVEVVEAGMTHSVEYGMAHDANVPGLQIAGKTGTASDQEQAWTHGWFAGIATGRTTEIVVVIYLPRGNGSDAARLARSFLIAWKDEDSQ
jgi:beta-lactamase class D